MSEEGSKQDQMEKHHPRAVVTLFSIPLLLFVTGVQLAFPDMGWISTTWVPIGLMASGWFLTPALIYLYIFFIHDHLELATQG